ncbi:MAG: hypothetical protein GY950_00525 [bacterium]|nr:hypothetical protein [bacterium]
MLVKDSKGKVYELDAKVLQGKEIEEEKAYEAMAAEKAAKKKKVIDMLSKMDQTEIGILKNTLLGGRKEQQMRMPQAGAEAWRGEFELADSPADLEYYWDCTHWDCKFWDCKFWDCKHWDCYWDCHWDCFWDCRWDSSFEAETMRPQESFRTPQRMPGMGPQGQAKRPPMQQRMPRKRSR